MQRRRNQFHRTFRWQAIRNARRGPSARSGAASVVVGDKLFVFGGFGGGTGRLDDFWSYDFVSGIWDEVPVRSEIKPGCRYVLTAVVASSQCYLILTDIHPERTTAS